MRNSSPRVSRICAIHLRHKGTDDHAFRRSPRFIRDAAYGYGQQFCSPKLKGVVIPAKERRVPFDRASNVDQQLLVLDGATHFTFSGNLERPRIAALLPGMEADPKLLENHDKMKAVTLAFRRWTLLDDPIEKDQLTTVLPIVVQSNGSLDYKPGVQQRQM